MATHRDHKNFGEPGDDGDTLKTVYKILGSTAEKTPKRRSPIGTLAHEVPDFLKPLVDGESEDEEDRPEYRTVTFRARVKKKPTNRGA